MIRGKRQADVPPVLQHQTVPWRILANINPLHAVSMAKRSDIRQPDIHDKFTGLRKDGGIGFAFRRDF
jgi:hypothetical protein